MKQKNHLKQLLSAFLLFLFILLEGAGFAQQRTITGTIIGADEAPLPGVSVVIKGTTQGTITDLDGKFSINAGEEDILVFSFIGYLTTEVAVSSQTVINLVLEEDILKLEEVVVVGYGTVKKSDITGSLSSVSSEEIEEMPYINVNQALQGKAAGVDIVTNSFKANSTPMVRVRGNRSIKAQNDPMYVIDGIPVEAGISEVDPMDIESIEVLKDASATAIYGSRAANGVIIITTKRGKAGKVSVNYHGSVSFENPLVKYDLVDGGTWMDIMRIAYTYNLPNPDYDRTFLAGMHYNCWESVEMGYDWNDDGTVKMRATTPEEQELWGLDEVPVYNPSKVRTYDWESEALVKNAMSQNHHFSVSGGTEKLNALFSTGYIDRNGLVIGQNYKRISPRINLDFQAFDWLKVGLSNTFSLALNDPGHDIYNKVTSQIPIALPYDTNGVFLPLPNNDTQIKNPLRDDELNTTEERVARYLGSYYAEITFLEGFKYHIKVGQDFKQWRNGEFQDAESSERYPGVNWVRQRQRQNFNWTVENLLFFNREIGIHDIGITLLQSVGANRMEYTLMKGENYPYTSQLWYKMQSTLEPEKNSIESDYTREQIASFMGRINYGLMDKYLLTASLRYDGTSKFYRDNRWDYFPSFAVAWKVNEEEFLKNVDVISQLKLRFGYGTTGQSGTSPYETDGTITESLYVFGEVPAKGYSPDKIATRDVGWEKTTTTNGGIDFGFFRNRISGTIEIYNANTNDLLLDRALPGVTGYTQVRANIGKMNNRGIEITLNSINIMTQSGFKWETDLTFSRNKEKIVELYGDNEDDIANGWFIGHPVGSWYTYKYDGIWQVKDSAEMRIFNENSDLTFSAGDIRVVDVNNDDSINTDDRTIVGHSVPDFTGGITNRISYKGFELSAFVYFRVGQGIYSRDAHNPVMDGRYNTRFDLHYYSPNATEEENASATHPMPSAATDQYETALWYQDASFAKVRHITLSYDFPQSLLSKVKINSLNVYVMATNPFLFTDYKFLDPEAQGNFRTDITDERFNNKFEELTAPEGISPKGWVFGVKIGL